MEWTKYTTKEALKDNDELMILDKDANANKRTLMDKIWDYVVDKMTTAVIAKLGTTDKTLIGAVNELNSNKQACLKTIGMQLTTDQNGILQTEISRKCNIVSVRSNGAIIEPFLLQNNNFWNAKAFYSSWSIASNASIYVTFVYFE